MLEPNAMENFAMQPAVTYPAIVGQVLSTMRKQRGLGQADLAALAGLTQSGWSRIERGDVPLTVEQLALVAQALSVPPSRILAVADDVASTARSQGVRVEPGRLAQAIGAGLVVIGVAALAALVVKSMQDAQRKR